MPVYSIKVNHQAINILGIHIPKTGGTALNSFFRSMGFTQHFGTENETVRPTVKCPPQHYHYEILDQILNISSFDYSFAIVRHPMLRCWSDFHWSRKYTSLNNLGITFDQWVPYVLSKYKGNHYYLANHIRPQNEFVGPLIKGVFKYEEGLETIIEKVFQTLGYGTKVKLVIPKNNVSEYQTELKFNDRTLALVEDFYADDYRTFNYHRL